MRRALAILLAAWLVCAFVVAVPSHAFALSCANPTQLTGYEGTLHYPPYVVQQDVWQQIGAQTMTVCSASSWTATATQSGSPETGIKAYPDSQLTLTDWQNCSSQPRADSFSTLRGTFAETPPSGYWSGDAAWDVFLNGGVCGLPVREIMVWNQWANLSVPTAQSHATVGTVAYDVYHSGGYIALRRVTQTTSGSVNLLGVFRALERQGLMSASDTVQFVAYGFEVDTTNGHPRTFKLQDFSVKAA